MQNPFLNRASVILLKYGKNEQSFKNLSRFEFEYILVLNESCIIEYQRRI